MDLVSVIIPTYNRFNYVLNTIQSIKNQTYKNIEIIVVNDNSTQEEYYTHTWNDVKIIHLQRNTRQMFGYACAGYVRSIGMKNCNGNYIAFCDDDDIWFPSKIEKQLSLMKEYNCELSCTDGLIGNGIYNPSCVYKKYNKEHFYNTLQKIYKKKSFDELNLGFPKIWNYNFVKIHNCVICSSAIFTRRIYNIVKDMDYVRNGVEDYSYWKRILKYTDCVYCEDVLFYYDIGHADGRNY